MTEIEDIFAQYAKEQLMGSKPTDVQGLPDQPLEVEIFSKLVVTFQNGKFYLNKGKSSSWIKGFKPIQRKPKQKKDLFVAEKQEDVVI